MDLASIASLLGSVKTATDIAKFVREADVSLASAEGKSKLADLLNALADAKVEAADIQHLLHQKEARIRELEQQLKLQEELEWRSPSYWRRCAEGSEGPFCQHCYDSSQALVRLIGDGLGYWECKVCKNEYLDDERRARDKASMESFKARQRSSY